jgi:hypothetical protein
VFDLALAPRIARTVSGCQFGTPSLRRFTQGRSPRHEVPSPGIVIIPGRLTTLPGILGHPARDGKVEFATNPSLGSTEGLARFRRQLADPGGGNRGPDAGTGEAIRALDHVPSPVPGGGFAVPVASGAAAATPTTAGHGVVIPPNPCATTSPAASVVAALPAPVGGATPGTQSTTSSMLTGGHGEVKPLFLLSRTIIRAYLQWGRLIA